MSPRGFKAAENLRSMGATAEAFEAYLALAGLDQMEPTAAFNAGNLARELGELNSAAALLRSAAQGGCDDAWLNLGLVERDLGLTVLSAASLKNAVAAGDPQAALVLTDICLENGQLVDARRWLRKSNLSDITSVLLEARVEKAINGVQSGLEVLLAHSSLQAEDSIQLEIGLLFLEAGDKSRARKALRPLKRQYRTARDALKVLDRQA